MYAVEMVHQTADGAEVCRYRVACHSSADALAEMDRIYREDGAEELGVYGETAYVFINAMRGSMVFESRMAEFL